MRKVQFRCLACGYEDTIEILTPEEERDASIPRRPVQCPRCGSGNLEIR